MPLVNPPLPHIHSHSASAPRGRAYSTRCSRQQTTQSCGGSGGAGGGSAALEGGGQLSVSTLNQDPRSRAALMQGRVPIHWGSLRRHVSSRTRGRGRGVKGDVLWAGGNASSGGVRLAAARDETTPRRDQGGMLEERGRCARKQDAHWLRPGREILIV
eukprot:scaffold17903_cov86-Isochrysis_galbana.AAC.2